MGIIQIEHLKDGVGGLAVLTLHDGVLDAHFLGGHVVLEHSLAVQTDPCVFRAGNGDLHLRVLLHILVDVLGVVGAEPQLAVQFASEHEGAALCLAVTTDGMEPFTVYPELSSTYVFARSPKNEKEMVFVERVIFPRLTDFYTYDLMNGLHHGHAPSQCQGCGKYFLTTNGHIPKYCDGVAPQDSRYTCRQYGAMMHQKEQNKQHPVYRLFATRTDTIRKHHQRGKISDDLRREALYLAGSYRDKALMDNDYAADGYARDMELEHIYAEAEKRLK